MSILSYIAKFKNENIELVSTDASVSDKSLDPEYVAQCVSIVEDIQKRYNAKGTIYPDEIRAIYKLHKLNL